MRILAIIPIFLFAAAPALAQEITEPRYEALEQQQQTLEQRQLDSLERQRVNEQLRPIIPGGETAASRQMRVMEIERQQDLLLLKSQQDRAVVERERTIAEAKLPNRRIAPSSILVVSNPVQYGLPRLPENQYYARVEGRFVVVDSASELVVSVLPVQPTDPTADVPFGPRQLLLPPVPAAQVSQFNLPPVPSWQYYSIRKGFFVLVDQATGRVIRTTSVAAPRTNPG